MATYHEGIDYCTKKLDVVKKESDSLVVQLGKVAGSINPITRTAVAVLVLIAFVLGFVAAVAFYANPLNIRAHFLPRPARRASHDLPRNH